MSHAVHTRDGMRAHGLHALQSRAPCTQLGARTGHAQHRQHPPHHSGPQCLGNTAAAIKIHSCSRFIHQRWRLISSNIAPHRLWHRHCLQMGAVNAGRVTARCNGGLGEQDDGVFMECKQAARPVRSMQAPFCFLPRLGSPQPFCARSPCFNSASSSSPATPPRCGRPSSTSVSRVLSG